MVHVCSTKTIAFVLWIHFTPHLVPISCTEVPSLYEHDAINGYVLQLAPEQKLADLFTKKPIWSVPFPTPAYNETSFTTQYVFLMISLQMCFHQFLDRLILSKVHVNSQMLFLSNVCGR